jgi:hypothetical protein
MNWKTYLPLAEKTLSVQFNTDEKEQRVLHGIIGICTEAGELLKALHFEEGRDKINIKEELGDVTWYIAILLREYPTSQEFFDDTKSVTALPTEIRLYSLIDNSLEMLDVMKKKLYYNKEIDIPVVIGHLSHIMIAVNGLAANYGFSVENILETNINKLKARYGDKFSSEKAINRDLNTERDTLSQ